MHRVFQSFIDRLSTSTDASVLRTALAEAGASLDLNCFAYLALPWRHITKTQLISTYPPEWTNYYLKNRYEKFDPVIRGALTKSEPFEWGPGISSMPLSSLQHQLFEEAARFGIRYGFTIPIHDSRGPIAAVTFAVNERHAAFQRRVERQKHVLQLMSMYFHAHARRVLTPDQIIDSVRLSPREFECLEWTAQGKSAWEIGRILGISRRTVACHLDNVKAKFGVHSNYQAVARLVASRSTPK